MFHNILMEEPLRARACHLFAALSNPKRLEIVECLLDGERSVGEIAALTGMGQSGASQHLAHLARAGVLVSTAQGTTRLYRVRGPRVGQILTIIGEFCRVHGLYGEGEDESDATESEAAIRG